MTAGDRDLMEQMWRDELSDREGQAEEGDEGMRIMDWLKREVPMTVEERASELRWSCLSYDEICTMLAETEAERDEYRREHELLQRLSEGLRYCFDDDVDAKECPFYDSESDDNCAMDSLLEELGLKGYTLERAL